MVYFHSKLIMLIHNFTMSQIFKGGRGLNPPPHNLRMYGPQITLYYIYYIQITLYYILHTGLERRNLPTTSQ